MNDYTVCRVMLQSYNALEKKCEVIDKLIYNTAIHSAFKNTVETYKEIELLTREKIVYINTRVIIDQALAKLNRTYEIVQHNIKGVSIGQIATTLGTTNGAIERRVYRQSVKLYDEMLKEYSAEQLLDIICDSGWLMSRYKKAVNQGVNKR